MNAISLRDVRKVYRRYSRRKQFVTLKSALLARTVLRDLRPDESFEALKNVSFDVKAGTTFGVIGRNGSGKSTALKLIAGIGKPTSGTVTVHGRVSALIELGAGFHPEISGRENVYINGMMLGLSRKQIARRFDDIVRFAELQDFIDAPVKTYSSGMYMRLGFAVAVNVDPDVLLVDEVLAVGDEAFTHKCLDTFAEFRRRGKTILLVTHSLDLVDRFCDEALWLDQGVVRGHGDPRRMIDAYRLDVARGENEEIGAVHSTLPRLESAPHPSASSGNGEASAVAPQDPFKASEGRWGSREVEITRVELLGANGGPRHVFETGERLDIVLTVNAPHAVTDFAFGVAIFNVDGTCCYGTNTMLEGAVPGELTGQATVRFSIDAVDLVAGTYKVDVAVHRANGAPYDYHRLLYTFRVTSRVGDVGIFRPRHHWQFGGGVRMTGVQ
jgi:ABC-type polysaccharide/polyol phosphate transport system ATPase subunit